MSNATLPRLVMVGPESSGKSALAEALAENMDGILVPEYLRDYFEVKGSLTLEDAIPIAQGQWVSEEQGSQLAQEQDRLLICDTDLISSRVYSAHYYQDEMNSQLWATWEGWSERHLKRLLKAPYSPRLYVLCGIDWPWIDDGQRDAPDLRATFYTQFEQELKAHNCSFLTVRGSLDERMAAVLAHLVRLHLRQS